MAASEVFVAPPWISVIKQQVSLPSGKVVDDYLQIKLLDYVIIFAETRDGLVIVERQYKHGAGAVTLVLPAGTIEGDETPLEAARRELLEETGYVSERWQPLGAFVLHGNYGCGRAHLFRVRQAERIAEPDSGDLEDMEIVLMPLPDLIDAVRSNEISMMSTMATIALATNPLIRQDQD